MLIEVQPDGSQLLLKVDDRVYQEMIKRLEACEAEEIIIGNQRATYEGANEGTGPGADEGTGSLETNISYFFFRYPFCFCFCVIQIGLLMSLKHVV